MLKQHSLNLNDDFTIATLPGPDTTTKRDAALSNDPRFQAMLAEAARVGWPAAFTDDLYQHDAKTLADNPGEPMLWILRQNGTHLYPLSCDNNHEAFYYRSVIRYWSGDHKLNTADNESDRARYYLVSDSGLTQISADVAATKIEAPPEGQFRE